MAFVSTFYIYSLAVIFTQNGRLSTRGALVLVSMASCNEIAKNGEPTRAGMKSNRENF